MRVIRSSSLIPRRADDVLYVNEMQTECINELERDESDDLIEALFAHLYSGGVHLRASMATRRSDRVGQHRRATRST